MVIWDHKGEEGSSHAAKLGKQMLAGALQTQGAKEHSALQALLPSPNIPSPYSLQMPLMSDAVSETGRFRQLRGRRQKKRKGKNKGFLHLLFCEK